MEQGENNKKSQAIDHVARLYCIAIFPGMVLIPFLVLSLFVIVADALYLQFSIPIWLGMFVSVCGTIAAMAGWVNLIVALEFRYDYKSRKKLLLDEKITISKRMFRRALRRTAWSTSLAFFIFIFVCFGIPEWPSPNESSLWSMERNGNIITYKGEITWKGAESFAATITQTAIEESASNHVFLRFNSVGGELIAMTYMLSVINSLPSEIKLSTEVEADGLCASACVPIWLAGQNRSMGDNAVIMIHDQSVWVRTKWPAFDEFANIFGLSYWRLKIAVMGSYIQEIMLKNWPDIYEFTAKEGVWNWWRRNDCWLTGAQVKELFPELGVAVLGDGSRQGEVNRHCSWEDPRRTK